MASKASTSVNQTNSKIVTPSKVFLDNKNLLRRFEFDIYKHEGINVHSLAFLVIIGLARAAIAEIEARRWPRPAQEALLARLTSLMEIRENWGRNRLYGSRPRVPVLWFPRPEIYSERSDVSSMSSLDEEEAVEEDESESTEEERRAAELQNLRKLFGPSCLD